MLRHRLPATLLPAALSAASFAMVPAAAAEKPQGKALSVVAQSTDATAATGRKPLAKRIAAANLPIRTAGPEWPIPGAEAAASVVAPLGDTLGTALPVPGPMPPSPPALEPFLTVDVPHPATAVDPAIAAPGALDEAIVVAIAPARSSDPDGSSDAAEVIAASDPLVGPAATDGAAPHGTAPPPQRVATVPRVTAQLTTPAEVVSPTPILDRFRDTLARWPRPFGLIGGGDAVANSHPPSPPPRTRQAQGPRPRSAARRPAMAPLALADGPAVEPTEGVVAVAAETAATESPSTTEATPWVAAEPGTDLAAATEPEGAAVVPTVPLAPESAAEPPPVDVDVMALVAGDPDLSAESAPVDDLAARHPAAADVPAADGPAAADTAATVDPAVADGIAMTDAPNADPATGIDTTPSEAVEAAPAKVAPAPVPRTHLAERAVAMRPQAAPPREVLIDRLRGAFNRLPRPLGLIPRGASQTGTVAARPAPRRQPQHLAGRAPPTRTALPGSAPLPAAPAVAGAVDTASASEPLAGDATAVLTDGAAAVPAVTTAAGVVPMPDEPGRDEAAANAGDTDTVALELTGLPETIGIDEPFEFSIAIHNASTTAIRAVVARVYFAEGIEPLAADGLPARLAPGVIAFDQIDALQAGATATTTIRAVGVSPLAVGYRIELSCADLEAPLSTDGTVTVTAPEAP